MSQPTFLINEIFTSIEGETSFQGIPMLFIRFTGCNLRCVYCDTKYAYEEGREYTLEELIKVIHSSVFDFVHITGGEPLLQKNLELLLTKIKAKTVIIETNGSVDIRPFQKEHTVLIVDMKTPGSGESDKNLYSNLSFLREKDQLKFVLLNEEDYEWSKKLIQERNLIEKGLVVNFSPAVPYLKPDLLAEWIVRDGLKVRLNLQIHKIIWGNKRGV